MSYLSASENVGFSSIPQTISDASCATQYKMAVEGVAGNCSNDVNMFIQDSSGDEQSYITHLNDNFFHTKFKIDPNELYTFHDSDVIANEITVSHTEDAFSFPENVDVKSKLLESPDKEIDLIGSLTNGEIKEEIKHMDIPNGHYTTVTKTCLIANTTNKVDTKIQKSKSQSSKEGASSGNVTEVGCPSVHSPKGQSALDSPVSSNKSSISSSNSNNTVTASTSKGAGAETFLDVFKREQGLVENAVIKTEPLPQPPAKVSFSTPKRPQSGKGQSQAKSRKGRGPAVHEALQRIPTLRAVPVPIKSWHAPGEELFECGPLADRNQYKVIESSSSDDDVVPDFESGSGPVCVEEIAAESRGARLALRRAALRRHVVRVGVEMKFASHHKEQRTLAALIKKQLSSKASAGNLPAQTVNHLLAFRGMPTLLSSHERRQLREVGWSGGESGSLSHLTGGTCVEERCTAPPLPCGRHCLGHVTRAPEQRLYAACAAVFAGGARCEQPLLPLHDQTPLCTEHAWKRDNYDKLARDCRPKKAAVRKRVWAAPVRPPRRAKRRRRAPTHPPPSPPPAPPSPAAPALAAPLTLPAPPMPPAPTSPPAPPAPPSPSAPAPPAPPAPLSPSAPAPPASAPRSPIVPKVQTPTAEQSLSEINVCSNSSAYDSSEEAAMGTLSENEYITVANASHELEVGVEHVAHDDILDPSVLSQIPDEAFTEFFNQAEGSATFAESSELAAALEAVLDERALDERALDNIADSVFLQTAQLKAKIQVPTSVAVDMSTSAPL